MNKACSMGIFTLPLPLDHCSDYPVIQYADDTVLFMKASQQELFALKVLLQSFTQFTGLKVNFTKTCLLPINISQEQATVLAGVFGCQVGTYPFTYLGLAMGTTKPRVEDHAPLVSRIERRITAAATWLTMAGRASYIDCAVSSIPILPYVHAQNACDNNKHNRQGKERWFLERF